MMFLLFGLLAACRTSPAPETDAAPDDCGDDDPHTYAGAPQLCDGKNNDCTDTAWSEDTDLLSFESETGEWQALDSSAEITLSEPGTLHVCRGTHAATLTLLADITIIGGDPEQHILTSATTPLKIRDGAASVRVYGVGLSGGVADEVVSYGDDRPTAGGLLFCDASAAQLSVESALLTDGTAGLGGGLYAGPGCSVRITDTTITSNRAHLGGGLYIDGAPTLTITGSEISENTADSSIESSSLSEDEYDAYGGGLRAVGVEVVDLSDVLLRSNRTTHTRYSGGGGAELYSCTQSTLDGVTFQGNTITDDTLDSIYTQSGGAGLRLVYGAHHILNSSFIENSVEASISSYGGGLASLLTETLRLEDTHFEANEARSLPTSGDTDIAGNGGGAHLYFDDEVAISGTTFAEGAADATAGGLYALHPGVVRLTDSTFEGNSARMDTALNINDCGDCALTDLTFSDNWNLAGLTAATIEFRTSNNATLTGLTFTGNDGSLSLEYVEGLTLSSSTFSNNATGNGAVELLYSSDDVLMEDLTFTDNTASEYGGAMSLRAGPVTLRRITLSDNAAPLGDAIALNGAAITGESISSTGHDDDLYLLYEDAAYTLDGHTSFSCGDSTCTIP